MTPSFKFKKKKNLQTATKAFISNFLNRLYQPKKKNHAASITLIAFLYLFISTNNISSFKSL